MGKASRKNRQHKGMNPAQVQPQNSSNSKNNVVQAQTNGQHVLDEPQYNEYLSLKKSLAEDGSIDIPRLKQQLETDLAIEIAAEKKNKLDELEIELTRMKNGAVADLERSLTDKRAHISTLTQEIQQLAAQKSEEEAALQRMKEELELSKEKARTIIDHANLEAKQQAAAVKKETEQEIAKNRIELIKKDKELAIKSVEYEARDSSLHTREERVRRQEEIYATANPEEVQYLQGKIQQQEDRIIKLRATILDLEARLYDHESAQIRANGRSAGDLLKEIDQLKENITALENKVARYSDFQLQEMRAALESKPVLENKIEEIRQQNFEYSMELARLKGSLQEISQLRSQIDLLRTLNEHLRKELETSKRALESRMGEVCPGLTQVDVQEFGQITDGGEIKKRKRGTRPASQDITLAKLVSHVKSYAASRPVPLYYHDKDLRAFLAGLAASKLTILQGLSGTGKTSLPIVFIDAIYGEKRLVPVESSWRDRNELLGYYNDFNRKFTAKEFTCHLYRAGHANYADTPFFIILDEMNLSRIEYYFADFLSVLEASNKKPQIKLVDVDLRSLPTSLTERDLELLDEEKRKRAAELYGCLYEQNKLKDAAADQVDIQALIDCLAGISDPTHAKGLLGGPQNLIDGNTLKIPKNVWFIGTANRDESTFEISDKVYDRAQVLNFSERGSKERKAEKKEDQIYIPYTNLIKLFASAREEIQFNALSNPLVDEIDSHLRNKYKITFGNRITMQMDLFVPVYVKAGEDSGTSKEMLQIEAIDYQLTNKVLRKLEYKQLTPDALDETLDLLNAKKLSMAANYIEWKKSLEG